ncbi:hypothetical protein [Bacillus thuringiensis]|uniref:hypothetical protein n=1 Tax=Bacillus thuringiensis TaxID=1428 RepID=UPI001F552137|nr:hypothetical protein [Bacillus thuringiensis]
MDANKCKETIHCKPKYIINDTYTEKEITYIHPVIHINREHVRYVPHHVYEEETITEVIDSGPSDCCDNEESQPTSCHCRRCRRRNCWSWL